MGMSLSNRIDLGATDRQASFLQKAMAAAGLNADFGSAIAHLSRSYVRNHEHFSRLLTEMEPSLRQEMYESMRPHLKFEAWPFDKYISHAKEAAEREQLPILSATGKLLPFRPAQDASSLHRHAQEILDRETAARTLYLHCAKCTAEAIYYGTEGQTKADVVIKARRDGWVYDPHGSSDATGFNPTEICPACETSLREAHEAHYGKPTKGAISAPCDAFNNKYPQES